MHIGILLAHLSMKNLHACGLGLEKGTGSPGTEDIVLSCLVSS